MATLTDVAVPDIGDFVDVPVVEVLVAVGDTVSAEDPLVAIESDKATMEVPAPFGGVVAELKVAEGDKVSEGTPLLVLDTGGGQAPTAPAPADVEAGSPGAVAAGIAAEAGAEVPSAPRPAPAPAAGGEAAAPAAPEGPADGEVYAGPSVRRIARERGIDLATVRGSGRKGRITPEDLEGDGDAPAPAAASVAPPAPAAGDGERVALTRIQQLSARNLSAAWQTIPHVTQHDDADITDLEAFRKQLNAERGDVKVTMVALLLKACAAALDTYPRFASSLDGDELVLKAQRHIGFAADTPNGLVVPVVRDVADKGLLALGR